MVCTRCKVNPVYITPKGKTGKLCVSCFLAALEELPDPDCLTCMGEGEYYTHSDDCTNDHCALAGGYDDCAGQVVECDCSLLNGLTFHRRET